MSKPWRAQVRELKVTVDAEALFLGLFAQQPDAFWLDSSRQAYGMGGWSYLGAGSGRRLTQRGAQSQPEGFVQELTDALTIPELKSDFPELPFQGGFVGYLGYGAGGLGVQPRFDPHGPDAELVQMDRFVAWDHTSGRCYAVAVGPPSAAGADAQWLAGLAARAAQVRPTPLPTSRLGLIQAQASVSQPEYLRHLAEVDAWLRRGDSYEACYTYQLRVPLRETPLQVYRRLRKLNPAPYSAYLDFGARKILSSSPERFLLLDDQGWAETKPIKGTIARGKTPAADAELAQQLATDPKSLSENLMIVDLLRNDLNRICVPGTVRVPQLMVVESYAAVHQLVSTISGRLADPHPANYLPALSPGGSMTGAPKIRTVQLLDSLEVAPRGVYSGVLGFFSRTGAAELSIVIRSAIVDSGVARIGTGGAITVLSDPVAEYQETLDKAQPVLAAFGAVIE